MRDVTHLVAQVREELAGELRERLRVRLHEQPTDWLVEQLMALVLRPDEITYSIPRQVPRGPSAEEGVYAPPVRESEGDQAYRDGEDEATGEDAGSVQEPATNYPVHGGNGQADHLAGNGQGPQQESDRVARAARIRRLALDHTSLPGYLERYRALTREVLESEGHLLDPPQKGGALITPEHRAPSGEALLTESKDLLHALLFGGAEDGVWLDRAERELLTLTIPKSKAHAIGSIMRAAREMGAEGTWHVADDDRATNTVLQAEYGEVGGELVGNAITATLRLINNLEINERVLYGRMENAEESTLDP
ncbi:hypothetical protein AB0O34_08570 [Sphaerisporangium sp. NPDC088356]|uniref:hypothetical protein n=1 Tax=Sphaerisporangium sp. NPDC088356 TaxID=3154871 RepID=UPI00341DA656